MIKSWNPSEDKDAYNYVKVMVYAGSGMGKTALIRTLMHHNYNPIVFNTDKGQRTLRSFLAKTKKVLDMAHIEPIYDANSGIIVKTAWDVFLDDYKIVRAQIVKKESKYDTIVIDSITELVNMLKDHILQGRTGEKKILTLNDYGVINERVRAFLRELRDLPVNVYVIALVSEEKDDTGHVYVRPNIQGKLNADAMGYFDDVYVLHATETFDQEKNATELKRYLVTEPGFLPGLGDYHAKTRDHRINRVEAPDLGMIFDILLGKVERTPTEIPTQATQQVASKDFIGEKPESQTRNQIPKTQSKTA